MPRFVPFKFTREIQLMGIGHRSVVIRHTSHVICHSSFVIGHNIVVIPLLTLRVFNGRNICSRRMGFCSWIVSSRRTRICMNFFGVYHISFSIASCLLGSNSRTYTRNRGSWIFFHFPSETCNNKQVYVRVYNKFIYVCYFFRLYSPNKTGAYYLWP